MKKFLARRITPRHGFTLVELLVVIGIIAILAAVTMGVGTTVINMAKRTKAQNTATQIQTAAMSYYTEYSVYPTPSGVTTDWTLNDADAISAGTGSWGDLITCLSGGIHPSTGLTTPAVTTFSNTRAISYLNLKASDVGNGTTTGHADAPLNPLPNATANPYFNIAIDGDYDGVLGATPSIVALPNLAGTAAQTTGGNTTSGIAVWANCNYKSGMNSSAWYAKTF